MARIDDYYSLFDVRRRVWDPNDAAPRATRLVTSIDTYEAHHTGAPGPASLSYDDKRKWLLGIERFHEEDKRWLDIFYHVFIFGDGEVWEGRIVTRTAQPDIPTTLVVHYPGNSPAVTAAQAESALRIARWAVKDPAKITYHSARDSTACPGDYVRIHIEQLRKAFTMPDNLGPQDLSDNREYQRAVGKGFISADDPARAASRSVVGVVADRVDIASRTRDDALNRRITALENAAPAGGASVSSVIAEIVRRLTK